MAEHDWLFHEDYDFYQCEICGAIRATGEPEPPPCKDAAAMTLGRRGGLKGGKARAAALTAEQRSEAASKAAEARWKKKSEGP